jgi:hypothetical protein
VTRLRSALANAALAAASIAIVLGALELVARVAERARRGGAERDEFSRYVEHDPTLGWRKRAGARVRYQRREYQVDVAINARGLRDVERAYEAKPGTFRVLAVGDSFVEGYTVDLERTVTQVLEGALAGPACAVEVLNGGTAAYSTDQEFLFYKTEGAKYSPQVVLLFAYYNDIFWNLAENYFGSPKPRLVQRAEGLVLEKDPVPQPYRGRAAAPAPAPEPPRRGSAAFAWLKDRLARGAPRAFNALARAGLWDPLGGDEPDEQMRVFKRRQQPMMEAAWERTDAILRAMAAEAGARGAKFAVVYVPSRFEVSDRDWELTRLAYDLDEKQWDRGLVARRFAEMGASAGFPVHDLTPDLRRESRGLLGEPYFVYDGHWNAAGHRAAALSVARFLRERGWAPACARGRI